MKKSLNFSLYIVFCTLFLFTLYSPPLRSQCIDDIRDHIDRNVVLIDVDGNPAVGIICGDYNGGRYILTVGHVFGDNYPNLSKTERDKKKVRVAISGSKYKSATCLYLSRDASKDFSLLALSSYAKWNDKIIQPNLPKQGNSIEFHENENTKLRLRFGKLSNTTTRTSNYFVDTSNPYPGASGSPVYTNQGLIGIFLGTGDSKKEVLPINHIIDALRMDRTSQNYIQLKKIEDEYYLDEKICKNIQGENIKKEILFNKNYKEKRTVAVKIKGQPYRNYIVTHPYSDGWGYARFEIPKGYKYFNVIFGIPDYIISSSNCKGVEFKGHIKFDNGLNGEHRYIKLSKSKGAKYKKVSIEIPCGASELTLAVHAEGNAGCAHATWADARFSKKRKY